MSCHSGQETENKSAVPLLLTGSPVRSEALTFWANAFLLLTERTPSEPTYLKKAFGRPLGGELSPTAKLSFTKATALCD